ncbi:fucose permease [Plasticicumulans lactativorans]|uniref:Fucose permease n=1 Tax=Plasticicumulans lactativorans TaxID=1133106 RepID=A0A4V2SD60_9GAMM|nr:MFS transporter [Plasticicumulans lactativorans]TCO82056.1 fucose permease [Plasticicumulans lactativorans]
MSASVPTLDAAGGELHRARWATRAQFAALGVLAGAWGAHIPSVKQRYGLDEAGLSIVLLAAALGAITSLLFAGRVVARFGARRAAFGAGVTMSGMLALMLLLPGLGVVLPAALVFGAGMSLFDVAINTEGSELEHRSGRAIMSNLHGMFSVGGMAGAALVAALLRAGMAPALQLVLIAAGLMLLVGVAARGMLDAHGGDGDGDGDKAHFAWPRGRLLVIGLLILSGMIAEGVMYDWCVLYLKQEVGMPQAQAALGYAVFAAAMALSRFTGDALRERFAEPALLCAGATLTAVSMAVVLLVGTPWVALAGFALVGAGLAPTAPILYNAATRVPGVSRAAAIASVTSIGYGGFMIGPPLIGGLAHATSLTVALTVVVAGATLLALGSRLVPAKA